MKRAISIVFALVVTWVTAGGQLHPDYENPKVFERNQVPPHATLMPYADVEQALNGDRKSSPFHLSLNGTWKFHWAENPEGAPADFFKKASAVEGWQEIRVPSNWQMEGFGYPLFRNIGLPFAMDPPGVPGDFNPVGSYFRTFDLPENWKGREIFLHFEGVHSASYVWVNGKEVGYNQGGMEPAEYDITSLLRSGQNTLAVRVLRYCDGTYMEDQDTWRLSGIYRDVYLISTPEVHIRDFYITTDLDEHYEDAILNLKAEVRNYSGRKMDDLSLRVSLFDESSNQVAMDQWPVPQSQMEGGSFSMVSGSMEIEDPAKWSAEYPNLYNLVMELVDGTGEVAEILSSRVGFREVEVRGQAILVNGVPIKFNGVNSHMMHPETGHAMDVETMKKDLYLMKQFNINCVRTSHYPPNIEYLDLADELGIYIVDETGDEAHAYIQISHQPEWRDQYLDRMRKMVYRDRNHPSIVIWSAGNESGPGDNLCALMEEGKRIDPSRPAWMYGGNNDRDPLTNPIKCEDIVGPRYLQPFRLEQRFAKSDDPRPSFMDEYIAATGNSLGGLDEYWELIYRYPRLTGGAIWDWISQGITRPVVTTRDDSPAGIRSVFMNRAHLVRGEWGNAMYLSGHDDWLEVARDPALDITGQELTLSFWILPEPFNGYGYYLTKGDYQFGIIQEEPDHLLFYVNTGQKVTLEARLPADWEGTWHHVAGIYDGKELQLYVDGNLIGTTYCQGDIVNAPYAVNIGKSAEIRDNHRGYLCNATFDRVRIFDRVISTGDLREDAQSLKPESKLWLDFETESHEGSYYSIGIPGRTYGLIWPDRSVQPELWQLKKSPQPVKIIAENIASGEVNVINRHHFRNLNELDVKWILTENGEALQEGTLDLDLPPGDSLRVTIPFKSPDPLPGALYHLLVTFQTKEDQPWARAGHEVAWEQFSLPFHTAAQAAVRDGGELGAEENEALLTLSGNGFRYVFNKKSGLLESMKIDGEELVARAPRLNVWRAPLANDLDTWNFWQTSMGYTREGMGKETANGWRSIGLDKLVQDVDRFSHSVRGNLAEVHVEASIHAMNYTTGFKVNYHYTIYPDGEIEVTTDVSPRGNQTRWLPKMGLQMELPKEYGQVEWFGRGPFENYPDRKTGAKIGRYKTTVEEDMVPYIIPQDYGNRSDVSWISLTSDSGSGIRIHGDETFNFSAQKYTTENLDRAHYTFQLKDEEVVTLNLDHLVSGVGGTANSVLNPYQVTPRETSFTFYIKPVRKNEAREL